MEERNERRNDGSLSGGFRAVADDTRKRKGKKTCWLERAPDPFSPRSSRSEGGL